MKKCPKCRSFKIVRNGFSRGKQSYKCKNCSQKFVKKKNRLRLQKKLWNEYVWHRQTLRDLACTHRRSMRWVQSQLDQAPVTVGANEPQKIVAITDTTFFGRGYGILVIRCPRLKKNVHFHEVASETPEEYCKARCALEKKWNIPFAGGYVIEAVVVDGKRGVMRVFNDIPVQMCQFHQIAIVRRYITCRPKLEAGKELRAITLTLPISTMRTFEKLLALLNVHRGMTARRRYKLIREILC